MSEDDREGNEKKATFIMRLSQRRKDHLGQLADQSGVSMTEYVERLIKGTWDNKADELRKRVWT